MTKDIKRETVNQIGSIILARARECLKQQRNASGNLNKQEVEYAKITELCELYDQILELIK